MKSGKGGERVLAIAARLRFCKGSPAVCYYVVERRLEGLSTFQEDLSEKIGNGRHLKVI